ncbi:CHAP domain-containing protein [Telmatospirillum sp.]|uniref:CHAP domain-containing protein n=1 Tax=Telmatospirillum sp. TaxID=2079197 RepID=UPI0028475382|nr:CHAP domain-containing protein [Telmatospirillum sp.]MDR3437750.1 CHAP domain-containing protein [Telmatospirillum sp.]
MVLVASSPVEALQCVPFAREVSGISIRGDAWTWWSAALGQYDRGQTPRIGAVVVFKKFAAMRHGHVAVVARVVNSRQVLVDHANWAPHRGRGRGQVSKMVAVADVSAGNDWSEVRVWNVATRDFGTRTYPTYGFIYPVDSRGFVQQASANASMDAIMTRMRRGSPTDDAVLATADQQIAAVLAEELEDASRVDVSVVSEKTNSRSNEQAQPESRPMDAKPVEKGIVENRTQEANAPLRSNETRIVEAKNVETKPVVEKAPPAGGLADFVPAASQQTERTVEDSKTMVAMAPDRAVAAGGVWEGDLAAAKMAGAGRY